MTTKRQANGAPDDGDEMKEFLFVVRRALMLVVRWIERKYGWHSPRGDDEGLA